MIRRIVVKNFFGEMRILSGASYGFRSQRQAMRLSTQLTAKPWVATYCCTDTDRNVYFAGGDNASHYGRGLHAVEVTHVGSAR
jgi:hypothetical protein